MKLHNSLSVTYETQILENGKIVGKRNPKKNLLLDSGLDGIAVRTFWDSFAYCVLGDSTNPTKRDSGATTVSITGEVATASAGFFEAGDVGRLLKLDSGQEVYITSFSSTTEVEVEGASDDAASEFTIWYVNDNGHGNELVRTNTLGGDSGDVETTWASPVLEMKRTFIFPVEVSARTYREIGWSHTATAGGNLFGRDLIPGGGDSISEGQQYKVVVRLQLTLSPVNSVAAADVGNNGFSTAGNIVIAGLLNGFKTSSVQDGRYALDPGAHKDIVAITADFVLPASVNSATRGVSITGVNKSNTTSDPYVDGSFEKIFRAKFEINEVNGLIYGWGMHDYFPTMNVAQKFTSPQTKDSDHTLEFALKLSWGRTLTN